jgi:hypothetical protein
MNDLHQPFLDQGETVYAARVDSVGTLIGVNKQVLHIFYPRQRAVRGIVYWNLGANSQEFTFPEEYTDGMISVSLDNLEEGNYTYEIYTFDASGNRSIVYEITSNVLSEETMDEHRAMLAKSVYYRAYDELVESSNYMKKFPAAKIKDAQCYKDAAWFMWDSPALPGAKVIFTYENWDGQQETHIFNGEDIKQDAWNSELTNAKVVAGGELPFTHQTIYEQPFDYTATKEIKETIDLGEEYIDRYYEYEDTVEYTIHVDRVEHAIVNDNW